jgi:hypothetical protein
VGEAQVAQRRHEHVALGEQQVGRLDELQRQRRVEQVAARHAEVDVRRGLARLGLVGPRRQERDDVVLGDRLDLGHRLGRGGRRRRTGSTLDAGTVPASACASRTITSTEHHSSYLWASLQTRPISGRV